MKLVQVSGELKFNEFKLTSFYFNKGCDFIELVCLIFPAMLTMFSKGSDFGSSKTPGQNLFVLHTQKNKSHKLWQ